MKKISIYILYELQYFIKTESVTNRMNKNSVFFIVISVNEGSHKINCTIQMIMHLIL